MRKFICLMFLTILLHGCGDVPASAGMSLTGSGPNRYSKVLIVDILEATEGKLENEGEIKELLARVSSQRISGLATTREDKEKMAEIREAIIQQFYEAMILARDNDKSKALRLWDAARRKLQEMAREELGVGSGIRTGSYVIKKCIGRNAR